MRRILLPTLITVLASGFAHAPAMRPLPFFYDLYTFRGEGGVTDIVAAFAVPAGELALEPAGEHVRYRFDVTLVLADTALRTVSRTDDSVYVELTGPLDDDDLLYTHIQVAALPSATTLHRAIMSDATRPGVGQLYASSFGIPDYSGEQLMVSDIALGHPDARSGWSRGAVTLALLPTSQFPASAFDVYYEIYNLPHGRPYTTEIRVERVDDENEDEQPANLRFFGESAASPDGTLPELRRIEASLPRGTYRIAVKITDRRSGESASRSRLFDVRGSQRALTMVPALPHDGYPGTRSRPLPAQPR